MKTLIRASIISLICLVSVFGDTKPIDVLSSRIIGGAPATLGQFPFQVGLMLKIENRTDMVQCGGVLIAEDYVLTAAHCTAPPVVQYIDVHLGTIMINSKEDGHLVIHVPRENFISHETWHDIVKDDIALLKLPQKVPLSDTINTVDLPTYDDAAHLDLEGQYLIASGWGRYTDASQDRSPTLQYVHLRVIDQRVCKHYFEALLIPSMICTSSSRGQSGCHGDSGGPLVYNDNVKKRTILIGLVSFGNPFSCAGDAYPSVFTRVSSFLDWISRNSGIDIKQN